MIALSFFCLSGHVGSGLLQDPETSVALHA